MEMVEMNTDDAEATDGSASSTGLQDGDSAARLRRIQAKQFARQTSSEAPLSNCAETNAASIKAAAAAAANNNNNNNNNNSDPHDLMMDDMDEEQLKRILACKRLSEGCNRFNVANLICRKNSLHMMGESLAPVTEGEPMRHMSHHLSQNIESTSSSSVSSGSFRSGGVGRHLSGGCGAGHMMAKRNSQDDNTNSCSSSTSLDGPRSPGRRRSSTVSQCSSVLSEGTRQQLNFDLSPDLPPDSSILEANAISPTDFERPASPEPSSLGSHADDGSFEMRPVSRMSQFCDDLMLAASSPDSTLGDSNDNSNPAELPMSGSGSQELELGSQQQHSETQRGTAADCDRHEATIRDNLERIISHVSTVKVSSAPNNRVTDGQLNGNRPDAIASQINNGQKRAHTPFGANLQRSKTSLISSSPSPSPHELSKVV